MKPEEIEKLFEENYRDGIFDKIIGEDGEERYRLTHKGILHVQALLVRTGVNPSNKKEVESVVKLALETLFGDE